MTQFHNRIRLPLIISKPQFPETREIYRKANGESVVQSVVIRKTYEGESDYLAEGLHQKIKIMLAHDFLQFEAPNYYGRVVQSGDFNIDWPVFRRMPTAKAAFQVEVTPFNATNSNCQTCDDASQVVTNDDTFYPDLNEDTSYTLNVAANDEICCFPTVWSITTFNTDYLSSATIDSSGVIHIHTKTPLVTANLMNLLTYRATCPNGNYDEADVFANINGTVAGCLAPQGMAIEFVSTVNATITFTPPASLPDHYRWVLFNLTTSLQVAFGDEPNGSTAVALVGLLIPGDNYRLYLRSQCDATDDDATASNYISIDFTAAPITALCGTYQLSLNDPTQPDAGHGGHLNVTYIDCNGNIQNLYLPNHQTKEICAMQTGPGSPTSIATGGNPYVVINYLGVCGSPRPTLTFAFVHAGSFLQLSATLSFAIDGIVNINRCFADGFAAGDCTGGALASAQKNSLMSIPVGLTGCSAPPDSTSGTWDSSEHSYIMYNCMVNGGGVIDGSTVIIGSYTVDIVIPACRP